MPNKKPDYSGFPDNSECFFAKHMDYSEFSHTDPSHIP